MAGTRSWSARMQAEADRRPTWSGNASLPTAWLLSIVVLALMLAASVAGLLLEGLYRDPDSTSSMLRGYDLVTLVVAAPVLALALVGVRRRSVRAQLVWVGLLVYAIYTYAVYLFGTAFSDVFLVHVAVFSAALSALGLAVTGFDVTDVAEHFSPRTPARSISAVLAFLAMGLGGMWVFYSVRFAVVDRPPEGSSLVETDALVHLGYVLDLALLVPAYTLAAVLLWRRVPWGYVLAAAVLVAGTLHQIGYMVALPFQARADIPGATAFDPVEPLIAVAFLLATMALLAGVRPTQRDRRARPDGPPPVTA